ncbi:MAG: hypothetical protein IT337_07185 [Thermomicrobiales bacterium]|nr:hypothetical protein [Thermomicrobiales bacterium]
MSDDIPTPPAVGQQYDVFPQIGESATDQEGFQTPRLGRASDRGDGLAEGRAVDSGAADDRPPVPPVTPARRQADEMLAPDRTGGSEAFGPTPGGTLLAPNIEAFDDVYADNEPATHLGGSAE